MIELGWYWGGGGHGTFRVFGWAGERLAGVRAIHSGALKCRLQFGDSLPVSGL